MNKKNFFLIIGVSKSGTTSLSAYLSQHENIFSSFKNNEPRFFVKNTINQISSYDPMKKTIINDSIFNKEKYFDLFKNNSNIKYFCEDSIHYFNHPEESIKNIKKYLGNIPIFIILRNPIDRLISNWKYIRKDVLPLDTALDYENYRLQLGYNSFWAYKKQSIYYEKIKVFMDNFSKVKILIFEDFITNSDKVLNDCLQFLDLEEHQFDTSRIINKTGNNVFTDNKILLKLLKNPLLYKQYVNFIIKFRLDRLGIFFKSKNLFDIDRKKIYNFFKEDIIKVEKLLNKDLSIWKE